MSDRLDADTASTLSRLGSHRSLRADERLFHQGDAARFVFLVESGSIRIVLTTPTGKELLVADKGRGELVGEVGCLDGRERTATAIAAGDVTGWSITPDRFLEALEQHGPLAVALLRSLSRQVRRGNERISARVSADTSTRLAQKLVELTHAYGEHQAGPDVELRVSQDDLAAWIGSTRESVARALKGFRDAGNVSTGRGRIRVHDIDALAQLALG